MDLGFDDIENTIGYQPEMEEKCVQLSEQLDWGLGQLWLRILINSWFQQLMMHISSVFTSPQSSILKPAISINTDDALVNACRMWPSRRSQSCRRSWRKWKPRTPWRSKSCRAFSRCDATRWDIMISWDWKWDDLANKSWGIHWDIH